MQNFPASQGLACELLTTIERGNKSFCLSGYLCLGSSATSERVPVCRHFDRNCGGCSLLHMKYADQVEEKEILLRASLKEHQPDLLRVLLPIIRCQPDEMMSVCSAFVTAFYFQHRRSISSVRYSFLSPGFGVGSVSSNLS